MANKISRDKTTYKIRDISEWDEGIVSLPTVQREFVWKPYQIENLWDSILRGYPIGSFVLCEMKGSGTNNGTRFQILDGQQRVTSIMLGFGKDIFSNPNSNYKIFIDLETPEKIDQRKFFFRVITRSHPWGYQLKDNTRKLSADDTRRASKLFKDFTYPGPDISKCFPYDSCMPVPFKYFLDSKNEDELLKSINDWRDSVYGGSPNQLNSSKKRCNKDITEFKERISFIHERAKKILECDIPALFLDLSDFMDSDLSDTTDIDELENLFIRLNSGGTPLKGEDLNYSILKAKLKPELPNKIKESTADLFSPSRFITIAYKLYQNENSDIDDSKLNFRIKPKDFQRSIVKESRNFESFIVKLLENMDYSNTTLVEYLKTILMYDESKHDFRFPYLFVSKISESAPEVMFMLMYRIVFMKDKFPIGSELHKKMLGILTLFVWFGKDTRNHSKLLKNIWICARKRKDPELFWSASTVERACINDVMILPPLYENLRDEIKDLKGEDRTYKELDKPTRNFFDKMLRSNKDLVLYAQREFLSKMFCDAHFYSDDINVPFDWDHIFPYSLYKGKHYLPAVLGEWYITIGNFRAWPYSLNREDQDLKPNLKLKVEISNEDDNWRDIMEKFKINSKDKLNESILNWSICDNEWVTTEVKTLKEDWRKVFELIRDRNLTLCNTWYEEFSIDCILRPITDDRNPIENIFDSTNCDINEQDVKTDLDITNNSYVVVRSKLEYDRDVTLSLVFYKDRLRSLESGVTLYAKKDGSDRKKIKSIELLCHDDDSYVHLFRECKKSLLDIEEYRYLGDKFSDLLSPKMKNLFLDDTHT